MEALKERVFAIFLDGRLNERDFQALEDAFEKYDNADENKELKSKLAILADENKELKSKLAILADENNELKSKLAILADENKELRDELIREENLEEIAAFRGLEITRLLKINRELTASLDDMEKNNKRLEKLLAIADNTIEDWEAKYERLSKDRAEVDRMLTAKTQHINDLTISAAEASNQHEKERAKWAEAEAGYIKLLSE